VIRCPHLMITQWRPFTTPRPLFFLRTARHGDCTHRYKNQQDNALGAHRMPRRVESEPDHRCILRHMRRRRAQVTAIRMRPFFPPRQSSMVDTLSIAHSMTYYVGTASRCASNRCPRRRALRKRRIRTRGFRPCPNPPRMIPSLAPLRRITRRGHCI